MDIILLLKAGIYTKMQCEGAFIRNLVPISPFLEALALLRSWVQIPPGPLLSVVQYGIKSRLFLVIVGQNSQVPINMTMKIISFRSELLTHR